MPTEINLQEIRSTETPRKIIAAHFKALTDELPISGGWGYRKSDACIIDKNDPSVDSSLPFDGIGIEYTFVEKRIYEEMIILQPGGKRFSGIQWDLQNQQLIKEKNQTFDCLNFEITAFFEQDWNNLKREWEDVQGGESDSFDIEEHERKRQEKKVTFVKEFWFDITSFYGQLDI